MDTAIPTARRGSSWLRTVVRGVLICAGTVAILLPAWLPNRPSAPMSLGTVGLLQALLLAGAAAVFFGAMAHAGAYRPVCRILALVLVAAVVGELEDLALLIMGRQFPETWVVGAILLLALITGCRHRRVVIEFVGTVGTHAGSGLIAAALLILFIFDRVIGGRRFWQAALGKAFAPEIPLICKSYLELLACYFLFIGSIGLALTLARRADPE
ncbi:MAG: hypothetical protein WCO57_12220 [Verrucomicrobiota bacterium]